MSLYPESWDPRLTGFASIEASTGYVPDPDLVSEFNYIYGTKRNVLFLPLLMGGLFVGSILFAMVAKRIGITFEVVSYIVEFAVVVALITAYWHIASTYVRKRRVVRKLKEDYANWLAERQRELPPNLGPS